MALAEYLTYVPDGSLWYLWAVTRQLVDQRLLCGLHLRLAWYHKLCELQLWLVFRDAMLLC
jgi:hypothetical protein